MGEASSSGPNILWICTDQQRVDTIGALGHRGVSTPNIDRLVAEGSRSPMPIAKARAYPRERAEFAT